MSGALVQAMVRQKWTWLPQVALTVGSIVFGLYIITRVLGIDVGGGGGGSSSRPRGRGRKRGRCGAAGFLRPSVSFPVHCLR